MHTIIKKIKDGNMGNIAAFFDIDGTIFRNSLMIEHFQKLITYEVIDPEIWYTKVKRFTQSGKKDMGTLNRI